MSRYSKGKYAYGICDRSGFKVRYKDLVTQWDGLRVRKQDYDEKHPRLELKAAKTIRSSIALHNPRPDNDDMGTVSAQLRDLIDMTFGDT
jgi:hypothetical protein